MDVFKSFWNTTYKFIDNIPRKCKYWKCDELVYEYDHFACYEHYCDFEEGLLSECRICNRLTDMPYETCLPCEKKSKFQANYGEYNNKKKSNNKYEREYSSKWDKGDSKVQEFFVYILQLNNKSYYAGQTRELRQRYIEHREGRVITTKYKNPKLVWYQSVFSRSTATKIELELKKLIDNNPREIRRRIMSFQDINDLIRK